MAEIVKMAFSYKSKYFPFVLNLGYSTEAAPCMVVGHHIRSIKVSKEVHIEVPIFSSSHVLVSIRNRKSH